MQTDDLTIKTEFKEGSKYINCASYSKDGAMCACGDIDGVMTLFKFKPEEGSIPEQLQKFEDHGLPIRDLAFSHDNSHLISVSNDFHINLTDVNELKRVQSFTGHESEIT